MKQLLKLIGNYKFNSILMRNFVIIILMLILPLGGFSGFVYVFNKNILEKEIAQAGLSNIARVRDTVDMIFAEMNAVSLRFHADVDVEMILKSNVLSPYEYTNLHPLLNLQTSINFAELQSTFIDSIYIFFENQNYLLTSSDGGKVDPDTAWWYPNYVEHPMNERTWFHTDLENKNVISQFRRLSDFSTNELGMIMVNLDARKLGAMITNTIQPQTVFIVDKHGDVIYNPTASSAGLPFGSIEPEVFDKFELGSYSEVVRVANKERVISITDSSYRDWKYVSIIPLAEHHEKISDFNRLSIIFLIFSVISAVILAFIISIKNYEPILRIIKLIENKDDDLFLKGKYNPSRLDEIKFIASNIIQSKHEKDELFEQLTEKYELLRKAQAIALQSQINPHFIFNTLETVNWKVMSLTNGNNEASDMIRELSKLLRYSLETEEEFIAMDKEMELVGIYFNIQKIRYQERLNIQWKTSSELANFRILKLLVQPIVENAIYHGIKPSSKEGIITISTYCMRETIYIKIKDNGVGMKKSVVEKINAEFYKSDIKENKHIGLANVNHRIQLMFGRKYGLKIQSIWGEGTVVTISFPKIEV